MVDLKSGCAMAGLATLTVGVWMLAPPAALITAGSLLLLAGIGGYWLDRRP